MKRSWIVAVTVECFRMTIIPVKFCHTVELFDGRMTKSSVRRAPCFRSGLFLDHFTSVARQVWCTKRKTSVFEMIHTLRDPARAFLKVLELKRSPSLRKSPVRVAPETKRIVIVSPRHQRHHVLYATSAGRPCKRRPCLDFWRVVRNDEFGTPTATLGSSKIDIRLQRQRRRPS